MKKPRLLSQPRSSVITLLLSGSAYRTNAFARAAFKAVRRTGSLGGKGGVIRLALFDFAEEELASCGMRTVFHTRDLHSSPMARENVMTEYEAKFTEKGVRICMLEAELS